MKTTLVTGGAIRIGADIVGALSADCWRVIAHYNGSGMAAEALAAQVNECGGQVETIRCDLSDLEATERLIPDCVALVGTIDCLINNASLFEPDWLRTWMRHNGSGS